MRKITVHIIHCSDTPDNPSTSVVDVGVTEIDRWHRDQGWDGCGYHNVIRRSGKLESGRHLSEIGAHVKGHNRDSIGTCLVGRSHFTDEQFNTLRRLHEDYEFSFPGIKIAGHRDFDKKKTCPNFDANGWWEIQKMNAYYEEQEKNKNKVEKKSILCIIWTWLKGLLKIRKDLIKKGE